MHDKVAAGFLDELRALWGRTDPRLKAAIGAGAGYGAFRAAGDPLHDYLSALGRKGVEMAEGDKVVPIEKDESGAEVLKWVRRFKEEHPSVEDVPVYVSGVTPGSFYVSGTALKVPGMKEVLKEELGVVGPGVYIKEKSAPAALHELGHAALEKKVPGISLLTHGASLLGLVPVAMAVFRKPGTPAGFVHRYAPAIAAALQVPMLAEEAAASIMAEKTLRGEGETGKGMLVPAWLSHALMKTELPLMAAGAALLRKV